MRGVVAASDLVEFAFESQAADHLTPEARARMARQTWSANVRAGLTGELRLENGRFMQVVEGRCADVLKLAARILADPRHSAIRILAFRTLPARRYVAWSVTGFDLHVAAPVPRAPAANLRFLQARAAARLLEVGVPAS